VRTSAPNALVDTRQIREGDRHRRQPPGSNPTGSGGRLTFHAKRDPRQFPPASSEPLSQREPRTTAESHPADAGSLARRPRQGVWRLPRTTQAHRAQLAGQTSRPETRKDRSRQPQMPGLPRDLFSYRVLLVDGAAPPGIEDHPVDAGLPDKLDCHMLLIGAVGDPTSKKQRRLCAVVRCGCLHVAWAARPSPFKEPACPPVGNAPRFHADPRRRHAGDVGRIWVDVLTASSIPCASCLSCPSCTSRSMLRLMGRFRAPTA
jgi:hypothetical protein